jgi:hypothetical protein
VREDFPVALAQHVEVGVAVGHPSHEAFQEHLVLVEVVDGGDYGLAIGFFGQALSHPTHIRDLLLGLPYSQTRLALRDKPFDVPLNLPQGLLGQHNNLLKGQPQKGTPHHKPITAVGPPRPIPNRREVRDVERDDFGQALGEFEVERFEAGEDREAGVLGGASEVFSQGLLELVGELHQEAAVQEGGRGGVERLQQEGLDCEARHEGVVGVYDEEDYFLGEQFAVLPETLNN